MPSFTRNLSKEQARREGLAVCEIVEGYLIELDRLYPSFDKKTAMTLLTKIELCIKETMIIYTEREIDQILGLVTKEFIYSRPKISSKLKTFWDAHLEMAEISSRTNLEYNPMNQINQNRKEILKISDKYNSVAVRFMENSR